MYVPLLLVGVFLSPSYGAFESLVSEFNIDSNCTSAEFTCRNTRCVPITKRCDGHNNCQDNSDEEDCDLYLCKDPYFFRCKNGRCVSKSFMCDGADDCEDFSDEENCENFRISSYINSSCSDEEWRCKDRLCIPKDWVCDGVRHCLDGSDETIGCDTSNCGGNFTCNNHQCVRKEWVCDGTDDCGDGSDEIDCNTKNHTSIEDCTWDNEKFLCNDRKTCLDLKEVCDGTPQCSDRSDESVMCTVPHMSCKHHQCPHQCVQLPTGPKCLCPKGYHYVNDKTCQDINECDTYGICDQKCHNTQGSYSCSCDAKYTLQEDKKTCKATGGEAMMLFSSKSEVRGYFLTSQVYFSIANKLKQVVGVSFDGKYVYWTDIHAEHESIVRSLEDGSQQELLVTSGLGTPEDLEVDWLTGNIYFTDAERQYIGVCTRNGTHCTILINKDIKKPRAIVLNIEDGEMFWTDWGEPAKIGRALMDGSEDTSFVSTDIHWPNGLALDYPNQRLYWTDAKAATLESIKLDGTDRRTILEGVVRHPYSIDVFENKLYWSDWTTHSIQTCDKFTGKHHRIIIRENKEYIYGIHIFHPALRGKRENPCLFALCSDICLIRGSSYKCACPPHKELSVDYHTCKLTQRKQTLVAGAKNVLVKVEHQRLGKHNMIPLTTLVKDLAALAFDPTNNTLFVSDHAIKQILAINLDNMESKYLGLIGLGSVTSMDFDFLGGNLYWGDEEKGTVEVLNMRTQSRRVLLHDMNGEIPESIALVPSEGLMYVALTKKLAEFSHIDRLNMDGTGRTHLMENHLLGPVSLLYDRDLHRIFFADSGAGKIESTSIEGDDRHGFRSLNTNPVGLASLNSDVFWVNERSRKLYWGDKYNSTFNKRISLDLPEDLDQMHLISVTPRRIPDNPCQHNNANCSHLCLLSQKHITCACPIGMTLLNDKKTCAKVSHCDSTEFTCAMSNMCIPRERRCDSHRDCHFGEDEDGCRPKNRCPEGQFMCDDGVCLQERLVCDASYDCGDKSDEHNCSNHLDGGCPPKHFRCGDGSCVSERFICDGIPDCGDKSDEINCLAITCEVNQFRCDSGSCIPKTWECDREYDCPDLSDEHQDCASVTCPPASFTCNNGKCVDIRFKCDRTDDCGDNSDEETCEPGLTPCLTNEFACTSNTSVCLPQNARCNGTAECPLHEDELHCGCGEEEFKCGNKKCIPHQWICDKVDDCGDGSDEVKFLCQLNNRTLVPIFGIPCEDGFRCKTGHCIDMSQVCNKEENCYDGSDEGGSCDTSCEPSKNPCSQICVKTPAGPICKCRDGYELKGDGQTCADIDECNLATPKCSQICANKPGTHLCDCYDGYLLRADKLSCKAEGHPMYMLFTSDNQIRQLSQLENSLRLIYSEETAKITGLDLVVSTNEAYFSIENSGTLHSINILTKSRRFLKQVGQPQKLAVDWITNNVYFYDAHFNTKSISICNFDDKMCASLFDVDIHSQVSALAIDAFHGYLFYVVTYWWVFNSPSYTIYRTDLDGSDKHELVKTAAGYITGIDFDVDQKKLYFVDQHTGEINRINYDGTMKHKVIGNLTRPSGLKFFENHLYYLTTGGYVGKCQLYDKLFCEVFKLDGYVSDLFVIGQKSKQPTVANPCANHTCSHICIPTRKDFKCLCEDGSLKSTQCSDNELKSSLDKKAIFGTYDEGNKTSNSGAIAAAILIPLGAIVGCSMCYYIIRRRNSGSMNISMRFYNPGYGLLHDEHQKPVLQPSNHEFSNPIEAIDNDLETSDNSTESGRTNPLVSV